MKVSLHWVRQFTDITVPDDELAIKIGAQLGEVESVEDLGKKYQGIIISKVVSCEKHPNADKLNVCMIDDGGRAVGVERNEQGLVQVVCGAPNVRTGLTVAWLPPGSTVPSSFDSDPFVLGSRELRGIKSNGMLASSQELAISDDHSGIVELEAGQAGDDFAAVFGLNDTIIDIENKMFTHRPDCFGILGVAREIAGIQHLLFKSPDWYSHKLMEKVPRHGELELSVQNKLEDLVPRFMAVTMSGVKVGPSPFAVQTLLSRVGLRPINNVVDVTNYIMYLTGQPVHAYDADKLKKYGDLSLETRLSRPGDSITLLNGKTLEISDDSTILITSNDVPVGVAGCMGGADTEVDDTTTNIVLECANFDMYAIRRASMRHGLFTDAVSRFNKGQSPLQNEVVLHEMIALMESMTGGHLASKVVDLHAELPAQHQVTLTAGFINERLGAQLSADEIASLLTNVECETTVHGETLTVTQPFWRTDLLIAEDIVEEVGRLYGYDQLPLKLPQRSIVPAKRQQSLEVKQILRNRLSAMGANEVLTYGFVHGNSLQKAGQSAEYAFRINNALSPDLQYYRLSITPSLIEKVHGNIKAGHDSFALFELGKTHTRTDIAEDGLPKEFERLAFTLARRGKTSSAAYYHAKYYLEQLFGASAQQLRFEPLENAAKYNHNMFEQMLAPFEPKRSAMVFLGESLIGVLGEYSHKVAKQFKLPQFCAGFELFMTPIADALLSEDTYLPLSRFPKTEQDITLRVSADTPYQAVEALIKDRLFAQPDAVVSVRPLSIYQRVEDTSTKQISFRVSIGSYVKTMTTEEVNGIMADVESAAAEALGAVRI